MQEKSISSDYIFIFSNRKSGNMSLFYGNTKDALKNRNNFLSGAGINYQDLICAKQVHGSRVQYVTENDKGSGASDYGASIPDTDAIITDKNNLPLAMFTADCLSIFLFDPLTLSIGLIHAGWRSSKENIVYKTIQAMQEKFGANPEDLFVEFGPSIRECCYEVKDEFKGLFPVELIKRDGKFYLNLSGINKMQLLDSGVKESNISDPAICTSCRNGELFSYRREGVECGRMISVAMLK